MLKTKQVGKTFEITCVDITLDDSSDEKLATRIKSWVYGNSARRCRPGGFCNHRARWPHFPTPPNYSGSAGCFCWPAGSTLHDQLSSLFCFCVGPWQRIDTGDDSLFTHLAWNHYQRPRLQLLINCSNYLRNCPPSRFIVCCTCWNIAEGDDITAGSSFCLGNMVWMATLIEHLRLLGPQIIA